MPRLHRLSGESHDPGGAYGQNLGLCRTRPLTAGCRTGYRAAGGPGERLGHHRRDADSRSNQQESAMKQNTRMKPTMALAVSLVLALLMGFAAMPAEAQVQRVV